MARANSPPSWTATAPQRISLGIAAYEACARRLTRYQDLVLLLLFAFVGLQLAVAVALVRRIRSEDDFLVAGRQLGAGLAAISIFATWFGAESCCGAAGRAYEGGLSWNAPEPFAYGACLVLTGLFFAARLWRLRITTMADFFSQRFGASSERLAAVLLLPSSLLWAGAQIRAFGQVVAVNSDGALGIEASIAIAAVIGVVYTACGGLLADVYTDVIQCTVLLLGIAALAFAVWSNMPEGAGADMLPLPSAATAAPAAASWWAELESWAIPICGSVVAQEILSRTLAGRSAAVARRAAISGGLLYICVGAVPLTIGAVGPRFVAGLSDPELILPTLSQQLLPAGLNLLFGGALIAAILSTVDSCLLVISALVTRNLSPRAPQRETASGRLRLPRGAAIAGGALAYGLATSDSNVSELVEEASGFGSAGAFVLAVAGLYTRHGGSLAANMTLLTGLGVWLFGRHIAPAACPHPYLCSLAGALLAFMLGCALERLRSAPARHE